MSAPLRLALVLALAALATALLARLAARIGWTDAPRGAEAARKRQKRPVPCVGGAALLLALLAAPPGFLEEPGSELWGAWLPARPWILASLAGAFLAGTWDDRRGLAPGAKLLAQTLALAPLVVGSARAHGAFPALGLLLVGLVALNLLNTWDNADGALAGLCALGFAFGAPVVSAACLGFLPWNLDAARARNRASGAPSAYLGDAGAFVLALLVLATPRAAGILVLPGLDLARLSLERWRRGSRPWRGDREHLAHRLEARGLARPLVAVLLCVTGGPACGLVARGLALGRQGPALLGLLATGLLFLVALAGTRRRGGSSGGLPCPPRGGSE